MWRFAPNARSMVAGAMALTLSALAYLGAQSYTAPPRPPAVQVRALATIATTSSTVAPTTTTAARLPPRPPRAARLAAPPPSMDAAFWRRLANCESADGRSGTFLGYFQFSRDTARKVGWFGPKPTPRESDAWTYDEQLAMAQRWLAMIGGPSRGGTRSGWPVCWWRALR